MTSGEKAIAIVDASANAFADLQNSPIQFGLTAISSTSFQGVYAPKGGNVRLFVKAGIADHEAALLIIIAATTEGKKVLLACESAERESKEGWSGILRVLISLGLRLPQLTVADGHMGIRSALGELHPEPGNRRLLRRRSQACSNCQLVEPFC